MCPPEGLLKNWPPLGATRPAQQALSELRWNSRNLFVFVLVSDLEPFAARILRPFECSVGHKWDPEVDEDRTIVAVLHFHVVVAPSKALD